MTNTGKVLLFTYGRGGHCGSETRKDLFAQGHTAYE